MQNDVQIPAGMRAWASDQKPNDIDTSEPVMFSGGRVAVPDDYDHPPLWREVIAYTPRAPETGEPVADEARAREVRRNPDDPEWSYCPACKTGFLDTGFECNSCGFDAQPLVALQEACEDSGDRMHPSGLYQREIDNPIRLAFRETSVAAGERWRERWYGSEPERGSAIVTEAGNLVVYLGGDEQTHRLTTTIVAAHNAALATPPAHPIGREAIARIGTLVREAWAAGLYSGPDGGQEDDDETWRESHAYLEILPAILALTPPAPDVREAIRDEIINTPETADFMAGVPIEAVHQRERWGSRHDAGKSPFDWFWLVGYLAQKAASAAVAGDLTKAQHHTISTAAALANWHAALSGADTSMRPGIEPPEALARGEKA